MGCCYVIFMLIVIRSYQIWSYVVRYDNTASVDDNWCLAMLIDLMNYSVASLI